MTSVVKSKGDSKAASKSDSISGENIADQEHPKINHDSSIEEVSVANVQKLRSLSSIEDDHKPSHTKSEDFISGSSPSSDIYSDNEVSDSEQKRNANANKITFKRDVGIASDELVDHYGSNSTDIQRIDRIGSTLAKYAVEKNRSKTKWLNKIIVAAIDDRTWIMRNITSKAMAFNVYGYIVHHFFDGKECNADTCLSMKNAIRDRMNEEVIGYGSNIDIMDAIHVSLLHGYDTGEKLYASERNRLSALIEKTNENCIDLEAKLVRSMVGGRAAKHKKRMVNSRYSKFVSEVSQNTEIESKDNDCKENEEQIINDAPIDNSNRSKEHYKANDENKSIKPKCEYDSNIKYAGISLYRFGYKFYYHKKFENNEEIDKYYNEGIYAYGYWYIPFKYLSVKEELLKVISKMAFDNEMESAKKYITSQYVKEIAPKDEQCEDYDTVDDDSALEISHLQCLIIYCNLTKFATVFSATFRKIPETESNESLKERNSLFREFSRLLVECVHCFGTVMEDSKITHFYHGINAVMQFPSTHGQFCSPTSTTTELPVAIHFAGQGIVLELANNRSDRMSFFECDMFSGFSNEAEKLFIQGGFNAERSEVAYSALPFKSVRNLKLVRNYEYYVTAIACLQQMIKGEDAKKNTLKLKSDHVRCLSKLINNSISKTLAGYDLYIVQMFGNLVMRTKTISVWTNFMNIHKHENKNYYFLKMRELFCELYSKQELNENKKSWGRKWKKARDGHEKGFVQPIFSFKFDLLFDLFPNLATFEIFHLPITHHLMKYILQLNIWNDESRRNNVRIFIKEEDVIYKMQSIFKSYDDCIAEYGDMYAENGLKISNFVGDANDGIEISFLNSAKDETCDSTVVILQTSEEVNSSPNDDGKETQVIVVSQEECEPNDNKPRNSKRLSATSIAEDKENIIIEGKVKGKNPKQADMNLSAIISTDLNGENANNTNSQEEVPLDTSKIASQ